MGWPLRGRPIGSAAGGCVLCFWLSYTVNIHGYSWYIPVYSYIYSLNIPYIFPEYFPCIFPCVFLNYGVNRRQVLIAKPAKCGLNNQVIRISGSEWHIWAGPGPNKHAKRECSTFRHGLQPGWFQNQDDPVDEQNPAPPEPNPQGSSTGALHRGP